jgi:deoxyribonuclease-4
MEGIRSVRELGLGCMELEFVRSVHVRKEQAPEVKKAAAENSILLTCHGPYWINLNAQEKHKQEASRNFILDSARITALCGGWSVCFHAAYYLGMDKPRVYETIRDSLRSIVSALQNEGTTIWIRPEYGGKASQWGSLEELITISQDVEMVLPCIDFGHVYARSLGTINNYDGFSKILEKIETGLGNEALHNMHIHMEGMEYGKAGEMQHLNLNQSHIRYTDAVQAWKDFRVSGAVICESPNIEEDALLLKKTYEAL